MFYCDRSREFNLEEIFKKQLENMEKFIEILESKIKNFSMMYSAPEIIAGYHKMQNAIEYLKSKGRYHAEIRLGAVIKLKNKKNISREEYDLLVKCKQIPELQHILEQIDPNHLSRKRKLRDFV